MKAGKCGIFVFIILFLTSHIFAAEQRYNLPVENSPYIGAEKALVTIVEFIDYQ